VVGPDGSILYTGNLAIAVLGRPEQVGRALDRLGPVSGRARFTPPNPDVLALSNCTRMARPFTLPPVGIGALRRTPGLPLAWVGEWYDGGRRGLSERSRRRDGAASSS